MTDPHLDYRQMTVADIDATAYIRKAALEGLASSEGRTVEPWEPRRYPHFEHLLRTDPDGAWVAVADGTVVGFSMGFTRGPIWFLAQLFVQPEVHARGIGAELLRNAMHSGRENNADVFSVVSSTSPVAQSLYMRAGMFGIAICYRMRGPVGALAALPPVKDEVILLREDSASQLAEIDRFAFGGERGADHTAYQSPAWTDGEAYSFALKRSGKLVAYGYCDADGHIGPFASYDRADLQQVLRAVGDWLVEHEVDSAYGFIPSSNPSVISALLAGQWRMSSWTFLKATERFGHLDCYVPGGGLLL